MNSCRAITSKGKQCRANPLPSGFCLIHSAPGKAAELGRKGGQGNRHVQPDVEASPLAPPRTAADVRTALSELMADVKQGRVDPKTANCVAYISVSLLKAIEVGELEERIGLLESQQANAKFLSGRQRT